MFARVFFISSIILLSTESKTTRVFDDDGGLDEDGFNWGYDPVHYGVPEGSYASDPNGASRILEFRKMVQAIHKLGLRVVLDVVYNHTFHSGLDGKPFFMP